jgi:hypothetical protein
MNEKTNHVPYCTGNTSRSTSEAEGKTALDYGSRSLRAGGNNKGLPAFTARSVNLRFQLANISTGLSSHRRTNQSIVADVVTLAEFSQISSTSVQMQSCQDICSGFIS